MKRMDGISSTRALIEQNGSTQVMMLTTFGNEEVLHVFSKFGASDRAAAIVYAYDHGIVIPRR